MIYLLTLTTILFASMSSYFIYRAFIWKMKAYQYHELVRQVTEHNQMLEFKLRMQDSAIRQSWKKDVLDAEIIG